MHTLQKTLLLVVCLLVLGVTLAVSASSPRRGPGPCLTCQPPSVAACPGHCPAACPAPVCPAQCPAQCPVVNSTVQVTLTDCALTIDQSSIPAGNVTFVVTNRGTVPHSFAITGPGGMNMALLCPVNPGATATLNVPGQQVGSYTVFSPMNNGATAQGMITALTVTCPPACACVICPHPCPTVCPPPVSGCVTCPHHCPSCG